MSNHGHHPGAAYRIQSANRDVCDLLDPEQQPFPMNQGENLTRHGLSGCLTTADLAATHNIKAAPQP